MIGIGNPRDVAGSTATRPPRVNSGVGERRYFSDDLNTEVTQQDLNDIWQQIRFAVDWYSVTDVEGDDSMLQKSIAAGAGSLTGNLQKFQALVGGADKVPYFTSASAMALMTVTAFSRDLLSKTNAAQWKDALGISAALSDNVTALGNLTSAADLLPYFSGVGTMATAVFKPFARTLLDDVDALTARGTLGLAAIAASGSAADLTGILASARLPASLASIYTLTPAADRLPYYTSTSVASLATFTAFGRSLIDDANAAAARVTLGLADIAASGSASDLTIGLLPDTRLPTSLLTIYSLSPAADRIPYYTGPLSASLTTLTSFARTLLAGTTAGAVRTTLGLAAIADSGDAADLTGTIASGRLPNSLASIYALTPAADRLPYYTSASVAALATFTSFGRSLVDDADATAGRSTLGLGTMSTEAAADYAPLAGATFTGNVTVDKTGLGTSTMLNIAGDSGQLRTIDLKTGTSLRWRLQANAVAESGSNAGSNFVLQSYDDAGALIGIVFTISRSTRVVTFSGATPLSVDSAGGGGTSEVATVNYVQGEIDVLGQSLAPIALSGSASDLTSGTVPSTVLPNSLKAIHALTPAADRLPYYTSGSVAALATFTAFGRSLIDDADAAAGRTTLGLGTIATLASSAKVDTAGDTMTGSLILQADGSIATSIRRYSTNVSPPEMVFRKARGTNAATTVVATNDQLGQVNYGYYDGAAFQDAVFLRSLIIAATPSATDGQARLTGLLNAAGSVTPTELFRFDHATGFSMYGANPVIDQNRIYRAPPSTVAGLPTAVAGMITYVTDATANTRLSVPSGGGTNRVIVFADNVGWKIL